MEDRPKKIKGNIFPFDAIDVEPLLAELERWKFIKRYEIFDIKIIQVIKFREHQSPHGTEKDSNLPDENGYLTVNERTKGGLVTGISRPISYLSTRKESLHNGEITVQPPFDNALNPDSRILIPEIGTANAVLVDSHRQKPPEPVLQPVAKVIIDCPTDRIIELYEQKLPMLPGVRRSLFAAGKNAKALRQRWIWVMTAKHERGERAGQRLALSQDEGVGWFGRFFDFVAESKFLTNDCKPCSLGWLVKAENFEKVIASTYHEREKV